MATLRAQERLEDGETPRDDGFFDPGIEGHDAPAEELLEGALLFAANAYEQRKVPLIGRLYASLVFTSIPVAHANWLLRLAERLDTNYAGTELSAVVPCRLEAVPRGLLAGELVVKGGECAHGGESLAFDLTSALDVDGATSCVYGAGELD